MVKTKGRVRKFGDNIDTDTITPASTLYLTMNELKKYAFAPLVPDFYESVLEGDIIVGGKNFGCGSSREQATSVLKELGIYFIVCDSMARIYFRNCIALGLYPIICNGVTAFFDEGDEIEIDTRNGLVRNIKTETTITFKPLSGMPEQIYKAGGILFVLKKMINGSPPF